MGFENVHKLNLDGCYLMIAAISKSIAERQFRVEKNQFILKRDDPRCTALETEIAQVESDISETNKLIAELPDNHVKQEMITTRMKLETKLRKLIEKRVDLNPAKLFTLSAKTQVIQASINYDQLWLEFLEKRKNELIDRKE